MKKTRKIMVGDVPVGGGAPVSVQSMTNTRTEDARATLTQIQQLADAGCEIVRVTVPNQQAVSALPELLSVTPIPIIADVHFDYRLAIDSVQAGIHGLRINPGNIGSEENVRKLAAVAGDAGIPIRVGANSGSVSAELYNERLKATENELQAMVESLVESAIQQCQILEKADFTNIKVSLKSSDVRTTVLAYRQFSERSDYPLHLGVTEAGTPTRGILKSAIGIGSLLLDGIGDTIRVSLTSDPVDEVRTAIAILESIGLRDAEPEIIACPTCGRTDAQRLFDLVKTVEDKVNQLKRAGGKLALRKLAVMGCVVNGPGEARDAELALCLGGDGVIFFKNGEKVGVFSQEQVLRMLEKELTCYC